MGFGKKEVSIKAPAFMTVEYKIEGTAPLVVNKFSHKAFEQMKAKQEAGKQKVSKAKEGKDFHECFMQARHLSEDGWDGVPAATFRKAIITACKLVGFPMTKAKLGIFVESDGIDSTEGTPLCKIIGEAPEHVEHHVRLETGVADIRARPMWRKWAFNLRVKFDSDMFTTEDITALLMRAGLQCGICEGRPSSDSGGMDWGTFRLVQG